MATKSKPLPNPREEAFALAVSRGARLGDAYRAAGYTGKAANANQHGYDIRHRPHVAARVEQLARDRVGSENRQFARRQKVKGDILDEAVKRLASLAFTDVRELLAWHQEPVVNADGEVTGTKQRLVIKDSSAISPEAATLLKGAFLKAGELRIETHDQRAALVDLVRLLKGSDAAPANNVTVNQVNVGQLSALDAAQRVAFMLAAAGRSLAAAPVVEPVTIEGKAKEEPG